jgi:hypothetical protein
MKPRLDPVGTTRWDEIIWTWVEFNWSHGMLGDISLDGDRRDAELMLNLRNIDCAQWGYMARNLTWAFYTARLRWDEGRNRAVIDEDITPAVRIKGNE